MSFSSSRSSRTGLRGPVARRALVTVAAATLGGAALAAVPASVASAASRTTLYVKAGGSDTSNNCTNSAAPCATVTHALTLVAPTGTTIKVLGGPLDEQVTVNKNNVTIDGGGYSIKPSTQVANGTTPESRPVEAIVVVPSGMTGVVLKNVTLDGTSMGSAGSCVAGPGHTGLFIRSATVTLSKVNVEHISQGPGLRGCQNGLGIYVRSDGGPNANVTINGGQVFDYDKNGITCNDTTTTCAISKVTVTGRGPIGVPDAAQNGIQLGFGAGGSITSVKVSNHDYRGTSTDAAGILLYDAAPNVVVTKSTVTKNNEGIIAQNDGGGDMNGLTITNNKAMLGTANAAFGGIGIDLDSVTNATVTGNTLTNDPSAGIALYGVTASSVASNKVSTNGTGILVSGNGSASPTSSNNTVQNNTISKNANDGILADSGSANNTFTSNALSQNRPFDIENQGTGNTFTTNTCPGGSSNPAGLCS